MLDYGRRRLKGHFVTLINVSLYVLARVYGLFTNFDERTSPFSPTLTIRVLSRTKMTILRTTRGSYQSVSGKKKSFSARL